MTGNYLLLIRIDTRNIIMKYFIEGNIRKDIIWNWKQEMVALDLRSRSKNHQADKQKGHPED
jgi:hypothetical protein